MKIELLYGETWQDVTDNMTRCVKTVPELIECHFSFPVASRDMTLPTALRITTDKILLREITQEYTIAKVTLQPPNEFFRETQLLVIAQKKDVAQMDSEEIIEQLEAIEYNVEYVLNKMAVGTAAWTHLTVALVGISALLGKLESKMLEAESEDSYD